MIITYKYICSSIKYHIVGILQHPIPVLVIQLPSFYSITSVFFFILTNFKELFFNIFFKKFKCIFI